MKALLISVAMILSTTLYAEPFDATQDPDLYDGYSDSKVFATVFQPGIGDDYGSSFLYSTGFTKGRHLANHGNDDAYASTLLDAGHPIDW